MGRPRTYGEKFLLNVTPLTMNMLRHLAARQGRTITEEIRSALDFHVVHRMRDLWDDPDFVAEIAAGRPDFDADAFRAELEADFERARAEALGRPDSPALVAEQLLSKGIA